MSEISSGPVPTSITSQTPQSGQSIEIAELADVKAELISAGVTPDQADRYLVEMAYVSRFHQGPLPAVETFQGYENVCKGAARDIIDMAKRQQSHTHFCEKTELLSQIIIFIFGMITAVAVVGGMLAAAVYCAINGQTAVALTLASGSGIALVAGAFMQTYFKKKPLAEPEETQVPLKPAPKPNPSKRRGKAPRK